jgi:hypothetical protein
MGWNLVRPVSRSAHQALPNPANEGPSFDFTPLLAELGSLAAHSAPETPHSDVAPLPAESASVTAIDLVNQAAAMVQSIEDHAAETTARAHGLAQKASDQLEFAQSRIRVLEQAQSAAEDRCKAANARAAEAEQMIRQSKAEIAILEERLSAADHRARNAEARVAEAEKVLKRVEDSIRNKLLSKMQPPGQAMAAAA